MTPYRRGMTFNAPGFRTVLLLGSGFGLKVLSNILERAGDLASDPGGRLFCHVSALAVLIAAGACFFWVLRLMFFGTPRKPAKATPAPAAAPKHVGIHPDETDFDPDAALARYMDNRTGAGLGDPPPSNPRSFGRKRL